VRDADAAVDQGNGIAARDEPAEPQVSPKRDWHAVACIAELVSRFGLNCTAGNPPQQALRGLEFSWGESTLRIEVRYQGELRR
jgi:hypothetical protein